MKKTILVALSLILIFILLFPIAWDRRYVDELGFIRILVIDKAMDDPKKIEVYALRPYYYKEKNKYSGALHNEGATLIDALGKIQAQESTHLVMGSVSVVFISQTVAEDNIINIMSQLDHLTEFESQARVVILSGDASIITKFEPSQQKRSDMLITDTLNEAEDNSSIPNSRFFNVMSILEDKYRSLVLPVVTIKIKTKDEQFLQLEGLALFNKGKIIGKIPPKEVTPYMLLRKRANRLLLDIPEDNLTPYGVKVLSVAITKNKIKISSKINNGHPEIKLDLNLVADIIDFAVDENSSTKPLLSKEETLKKLEDVSSNYITMLLNNIMDKMQHEYGADIFGIGEYVKTQNYNFITRNPWEETFPNSSITVKVNLKLRELGDNK